MKNFFRIPYDLKWIYDTDLAMDACIDRIMRLAEENTWHRGRFGVLPVLPAIFVATI